MVKLYAPVGSQVVVDGDGKKYTLATDGSVDIPPHAVGGLLARGFAVDPSQTPTGKTAGIYTLLDYWIYPSDNGDAAPGFNRAALAAGIGGVIVCTPGKTYRYGCTMKPLADQVIEGNKAKFKRVDKIASTTTTALTAGSTSFDVGVASAAGFYVGLEVGFYTSAWAAAANADDYANGSTQLNYCELGVYSITAINGSTLSVTGPSLARSYASGINIISACSGFRSDTGSQNAEGIQIRNLEIDGNKNSYAGTFNNWVVHCEMRVGGDRTKINTIYLHDAVCEGIMAWGKGAEYRGLSLINTYGNGIHLTGDAYGKGGPVIEVVYARANSIGRAAGMSGIHQHGACSISSPVADFVLQNWVVDGLADDGTTSATPRFIGGLNETTKNLTIRGIGITNVGNGSSGARSYNAFDFSTTMATDMIGLTIEDVRMEDSGNFQLSNNSGNFRYRGVTVDNFRMTKGKFGINRVADSNFTNITVDNSAQTVTPNVAIGIGICEQVTFTNPRCNNGNGAVTGIIIEGVCTDVVIDGGRAQEGQRCVSINVAGIRCTIQGMKTRQTSGISAANGYGFVVGAEGWVVKNCEVQSNIASGGSTTGILVNCDNSASTATKNNAPVIDGCTVRMADNARASIVIAGASSWNTVVTNNNVTKAVSDAGTSTVGVATNNLILSYAA